MRAVTGPSEGVSALLQVISFCAVNCYAIISGYVCYKEEKSGCYYAKYLKFWTPIFVYNVGITICFYIFTSDIVSIKDIVKATLPVTTYEYWYVNAYTALFFLIPWINRFVYNVSKKELNQLICILFMLFSFYSTFSNLISDTFNLRDGYSFFWLVILYIIGAWIKKNRVNEKGGRLFWVGLICSCIAITWIWRMFAPIANGLFLSYMSITIVLIGVGFVVIFSRIKLNAVMVSLVRIFSPAAFGVYLIHEQNLVRDFLIQDSFFWIANSRTWLVPFEVIGCAGLIFIGCLCIEKVRLLLFEVLGINRLIVVLEKKLDSMLNKGLDRICGK